jgi:hypothetical protein
MIDGTKESYFRRRDIGMVPYFGRGIPHFGRETGGGSPPGSGGGGDWILYGGYPCCFIANGRAFAGAERLVGIAHIKKTEDRVLYG